MSKASVAHPVLHGLLCCTLKIAAECNIGIVSDVLCVTQSNQLK